MNYFVELPKRDDDHTRWAVSDDAPSWLFDAVQDAHDGDGPSATTITIPRRSS